MRLEYKTSISSLYITTEDAKQLGVHPQQTVSRRVCQTQQYTYYVYTMSR